MSDLEPITRDEVAWSNGDLEPITRKEKYIKHLYDETQEIPDPPQTREEWFIKKAGEEIHDVTIEPLTATQNGTYSESGKAYSPVTVAVPLGSKNITANGTYNASDDSLEGYSSVSVDVPLPENGYLKKDLPTGAIATVTDAEAEVMPSLKIAITPVQEGSGDPSPTNIRPITGWSGANVTVTDGNTETHVTTIPFESGGSAVDVYGGTLDVETGVLTVTNGYIADLGSLTWTTTGSGRHNAFIFDAKIFSNVQVARAKCEQYKIVSATSISDNDYSFCLGINNVATIQINDSRYNGESASDFKEHMSGIKLVYELATPLTYQLSPTAIKLLKDTNNIFADTGDILDGEYWSKNPLTVTRAMLSTLQGAGEITEIVQEEPEESDER